MNWLQRIAERKIEEAIEQGKFDNLTLQGQPLVLEDLSSVPEELRAAHLILKNSGVLPPEMELRKEILTLRDFLDSFVSEEYRENLKKKLRRKLIHYEILMTQQRRRVR